MSAHLRHYEFYAESDYVGCQYLWQHGPESVDKLVEPSHTFACGEMMLIAYVPHAEKAAGQQCEYHCDHGTLRIIGIVNVNSRCRCRVGSV